MDVFISFAIPAIVGVGVGILSGMLGIGGGTILVPVFRLVFGMSPIMSTATSLFTIIPTSISGAASHIRHKTCIPSLGIAAGLGGALTSPLGVWLAHISPAWMIMVAAALVIGYSAVNMLIKAYKMPPTNRAKGQSEAKALKGSQANGSDANMSDNMLETCAEKLNSTATEGAFDPSALPAENFPKLPRKKLALGAAIGLVAGVASGYVGLGGGFIMVPMMVSVMGISMKQTSGTSLIAVILLAIPAAIEQGLLGNIDYLVGSIVAFGSIPGALLGARLVRRVPERTLRFMFGGFLIVAAATMALNELGILG